MIPPTLIRITFPLFVPTISLPSSCVSFLFHSALSLIQYLAFVSSTTEVGVNFNFYLVFRHFYLRLLSILVCLSKDVTGALVCSRGHSSSSFIIVRFIMRYMPGSYLFRSLHQLVATVGFVCECQLRHNRSGSMLSLCTRVSNVLSRRELSLY